MVFYCKKSIQKLQTIPKSKPRVQIKLWWEIKCSFFVEPEEVPPPPAEPEEAPKEEAPVEETKPAEETPAAEEVSYLTELVQNSCFATLKE